MKRIYKRADAILAWHWLAEDRKTANDYRGLGRVDVERGEVLTVDRPIVACHRGLHASKRVYDALYYAPGPILCRVRCWGQVDSHRDKIAAQHREVVWMADATEVLRRWACDMAEPFLCKGDSPAVSEFVAAARAHVDGTVSSDDLIASSNRVEMSVSGKASCVINRLMSAVLNDAFTAMHVYSLASQIYDYGGAYVSINRSLTSALQKLRNAKCAL